MYVMALEWQEGFSSDRINQLGSFTDECNPWDRLLSVHSASGSNWVFGGEDWPSFIATQVGDSGCEQRERLRFANSNAGYAASCG